MTSPTSTHSRRDRLTWRQYGIYLQGRAIECAADGCTFLAHVCYYALAWRACDRWQQRKKRLLLKALVRYDRIEAIQRNRP